MNHRLIDRAQPREPEIIGGRSIPVLAGLGLRFQHYCKFLSTRPGIRRLKIAQGGYRWAGELPAIGCPGVRVRSSPSLKPLQSNYQIIWIQATNHPDRVGPPTIETGAGPNSTSEARPEGEVAGRSRSATAFQIAPRRRGGICLHEAGGTATEANDLADVESRFGE